MNLNGPGLSYPVCQGVNGGGFEVLTGYTISVSWEDESGPLSTAVCVHPVGPRSLPAPCTGAGQQAQEILPLAQQMHLHPVLWLYRTTVTHTSLGLGDFMLCCQ